MSTSFIEDNMKILNFLSQISLIEHTLPSDLPSSEMLPSILLDSSMPEQRLVNAAASVLARQQPTIYFNDLNSIHLIKLEVFYVRRQ